MDKKKDPVGAAKTLIAHEAIARYIKNQFDAYITVGFSRPEALELIKTTIAEITRGQQKLAGEQSKQKGKTHGTGNI